jgi:L-alanine-DL-glutamate epimerase-like enolase superfamily enzyme
LKITDLRERTVSIAAPMRNSAIAFGEMTASAVAMVSDTGITGYAFDSIGRYGKGALLRERFFPRVLGQSSDGLIDPPALARAAMANEKSGGHGERSGAVALIEAAAWDLRAKAQGVPLWRSIADYYGERGNGAIAVYASCGHFRTDDVLRDEVQRAVDAGYRCVKIKAAGEVDQDLKRLERAAAALPAGTQWAVDVNGASVSEAWLDAMSPFKLAWVEEPASPLDYARLAEICARTALPIATGENLFSFDDARNLVRYGGLRPERDFVQVDPLLSYGVAEYARILQLWPRERFLPHAGHLFNAHCVAAFGLGMAEAAPDASLVYGGYWDGVRVDAGRVKIPEVPGAGFEAKANLFAVLEKT